MNLARLFLLVIPAGLDPKSALHIDRSPFLDILDLTLEFNLAIKYKIRKSKRRSFNMPGSYEAMQEAWDEFCRADKEGESIFDSVANYWWEESHRADNYTLEMLHKREHQFFEKLKDLLSSFDTKYNKECSPLETPRLESIKTYIDNYLKTVDNLTSAYLSLEEPVQAQRDQIVRDVKKYLQNTVNQARRRSSAAHADALSIW